jgi:hypothetical protein
MLKETIIFSVGAAIGAASTYFILKDRFDKQRNEEQARDKEYYKELYSNKEETQSEKVKEKPEDVEINIENAVMAEIDVKSGEEPDYNDIINKLNYNQFSTKTPDMSGDPRPAKKPYQISMDDYNEDVSQIKKIISYFEDDGVCMDNDTKEVLDNVAKDIGIDNLELINTEGNDEVYIRNEQLGIDYNVVSEPGSYEDYVNYGDE